MREEKEIKSENTGISEKSKKTRNMILRIGSLICALLLWIYVSEVESPTSENTYDVSLTVENRDVLRRDHELALITTAEFSTDVVLSGKKSTLYQIKSDDIKAYIDLGKITEAGEHELEIQFVCPDGTSFVSCNPQHATVKVDKTLTVEFPVEADVTYSNLPSAYTLGECVITDSASREIKTVSVSGPKSEIDTIAKISARADFGNVSSSVETKTDLIMYDNLGEQIVSSNLKLSVDTVKVKLPVYMQKILKLTVEQAYNTFSDKQIMLRVSPSTIAVMGDPKILSEMESVALDPINEKSIGTNLTTTVNTLINLPEGIEITSDLSTANITATLINVDKNTIDFPTSSISLKNLASGLKCSLEKEELELIAINSTDTPIGEKDVTVSLDLTNYTEAGTYTANASASVIDRINYAYIVLKDYPVTFTISEK